MALYTSIIIIIIVITIIIIIIITLKPLVIRPLKLHRCNRNVNIDVHARQAGSPKDLTGLKRVNLSVICSLINLKWV